MKSLRRVLEYSHQQSASIWWAGLCSVLNKFFDIAPEILIGMAVDVVANQQRSWVAQWGFDTPKSQLTCLAGLTFAIWFFESLFEYLYSVKWRRIAQGLQHSLRIDAYAHIQRLPMQYFEDQSLGNLSAILNDDINQLERFLDGGANSIIQVLTTVILVGAIFFYLSPSVAALAFLPIPVILFGGFYFQKHLGPRYQKVRERAAAVNSILTNNLAGIANIKSYSTHKVEAERLESASSDYRGANEQAIVFSALFIPLIRMAILAGFLSTMVLGGLLVFEGRLAVGSYSVLVFLTQRLLWPLTGLASTFDLYQRAMASADRVLELLQTAPEEEGTQAVGPQWGSGRIEFKNVHFAYPQRPPLLCGLNLTILPGQTVGLVGTTGSGKSSLIKLLLRFYQPQQGSIEVDGQDVRQLPLPVLRGTISYVGQEPFITDDTVGDNISYGSKSGEHSVEQAAQLAEAAEFVTQLPDGYSSRLGERGQKLSGGQRQRLSIARAIHKNAPILVFDEATSAVDNETEAAITRSIRQVSSGRTTIIIAHRLSTLQHADVIYLLEAGAIVESGTHQQLLAAAGKYSALWRVQTGGVQDDVCLR